jgi:hypothetical protein
MERKMAARKIVTGGPLTRRESLEADTRDVEAVSEAMAPMKERAGSPQEIVRSWAEECRLRLLTNITGVDVDPRKVEESVERAGVSIRM